MNIVIALVIIFGSYSTPVQSQPIIDGDVLIGNSLPYAGHVCTPTRVYGDPYGLNEVGYSVSVGEIVTLRELYDAWVMIRPAQWIPLTAVCQW